MEGRITFDHSPDKNIVLIEAPNGGGKTEMVFSFWWAFYGFDFSKIKEDTPYSLNAGLYLDLQNSKEGASESCWIELQFESDGEKYFLKRTETFTKKKGITNIMSVQLSKIKENGERSLPEVNNDNVERQLNRIIPKNILAGIIFDGERMRKLTSNNEDSIAVVRSVITQITNKELFLMCKTELSQVRKGISKELKEIEKKENKTGLTTTLEGQIQYIDGRLDIDKNLLEENRNKKEKAEYMLENISNQMASHQDSKKYEEQRIQLQNEIENLQKECDKNLDLFYKDLNDGYLLIAQPLLNDIKNIITQYDVPAGLTVEAVKSILQRDTCVCGREIGEIERHIMEELIKTLPPDNINSTLNEMARLTGQAAQDMRDKIRTSYIHLTTCEEKIEKKKESINQVSSLITKDAPSIIKELEKRREEEQNKKIQADSLIKEINQRIIEYTKQLQDLYKLRDESKQYNQEHKKLTAKDKFLRKSLEAIDLIDKYNRQMALVEINDRISKAYALLSEDYERGRRVYVTQFEDNEHYRMVSYYEKQFNDFFEQNEKNGTIKGFKNTGMTDEEIKERIILQIANSNSTGQSKINSLAFAKAILDYSNTDREEKDTQLTKSYPFLIDSPFTELSGENLHNSAKKIHEFAEQIVLLISPESLSGVEKELEPYIGSRYKISKQSKLSQSTINKE